MIHSRSLRVTALAVALTVAPSALAADGDLDLSFGTGGIVVTTFPTTVGVRAAVVQPDDKYVVAGQLFVSPPTGPQFLVLRYNADGTLDGSFGSGGFVTTSLGTLSNSASAVALMPDGDIVVGGSSFVAGVGLQATLVRLNPDGTPETEFGVDGQRTFALDAGVSAGITGLVVDGAGRLLVAGGPVVARLNGDGSPDPTFAGDGTATLAFGDRTAVARVVLQPDGRTLVSGTIGSPPASAFVARLDIAGGLDPSFGESGLRTMQFGGVVNSAGRLTVMDDGRIMVAAQRASGAVAEAVAVRLTSAGALDHMFGSAGAVVIPSTINLARVLVQRDGKLLAVGSGGDTFTGRTEFITTRLNSDGTPDLGFGGDGDVRTDVGPNAFASDAALTRAGLTVFGQNRTSAALARYTIASGTPFSAFEARAAIRDTSLELKATFTLGAASNGIDPLTEGIALAIGDHAATLDGSSLRADPKDRWKFAGSLFGGQAELQLAPREAGVYELKLELDDLSFSFASPLEVRLAIGDDEGSGVARLDD